MNTLPNSFPQRAWLVALFAGLLGLTGCAATTKVDAQWSDPYFAGRPLQGARVYVLCEAAELALQRQCEDQMVAQLAAAGASPVVGAPIANPTPGRQIPPEQFLPAARAAGARAVFSTSVAPGTAVANPPPQMSFGFGGFGGGYHSATAGGVGVSLPVGAGSVKTGYAANGTLTDVASGRLMWTAKASAPPSDDMNRQLEELAKAVIASAQQAGML
jgi:hypothetical protein